MLNILKIIAIVWISFLTYWLVSDIDGVLFPVVSTLEIKAIDSTIDYLGQPVSIVHATFNKLRNCTYDRTEWYFGIRSNEQPTSVMIKSDYGSATVIRKVGPHVISNLNVYLSPMSIISNSYAYVYHRCYTFVIGDATFSLWTTRSLLYDSSKVKSKITIE